MGRSSGSFFDRFLPNACGIQIYNPKRQDMPDAQGPVTRVCGRDKLAKVAQDYSREHIHALGPVIVEGDVISLTVCAQGPDLGKHAGGVTDDETLYVVKVDGKLMVKEQVGQNDREGCGREEYEVIVKSGPFEEAEIRDLLDSYLVRS